MNRDNHWVSWVSLQAVAKQIIYDAKGFLKTVLDQNSNKLTRLSLFFSQSIFEVLSSLARVTSFQSHQHGRVAWLRKLI